MYNYFMLIGRVSLINDDFIEITTNKEALEVNVKTSKFPQLKLNKIVLVKGTIKTKGLYASKLGFPEDEIKFIEVPEEDLEESTQNDEVENVEEPVITEPTETIEESQADNEYPEDFQPLYKVNEKITIKYDYDRVVEPLHILQIQPVKTDGKITGYNYKVLIEVINGVNDKSGIKIYSEDFLADNEVIEG